MQRRQVTGEERKKLEEEWYQEMRKTNFGFKKVEILDGNIGYLQLLDFGETRYAGEILVGAMCFLANTDALIIDLRQNGGGYAWTVQLLASYFFAENTDPVHLEDIYTRPENVTRNLLTLPYVPGKRMADKDLYILTSKRTFSAAESFTYAMKNIKRATVIGENTKGGAHPTSDYLIIKDFILTVPTGRSISPITKTDWEGVGVKPHIEVEAEKALNRAHILAIEKKIKKTSDKENKKKLVLLLNKLKPVKMK